MSSSDDGNVIVGRSSIMKVYCHANVMSYSVLGRSRSSIRTIMPYQCNVPLSDDGSVVSIAAASGAAFCHANVMSYSVLGVAAHQL